MVRLNPPKYLDAERKKLWLYYTKILNEMKVLTRQDQTALLLLVNSHYAYEDAEKQLAATPQLLIDGREHTKVKNPLFNIKTECFKKLLEMLKEFGLSPCSRSKANINNESNSNPIDDKFFK